MALCGEPRTGPLPHRRSLALCSGAFDDVIEGARKVVAISPGIRGVAATAADSSVQEGSFALEDGRAELNPSIAERSSPLLLR